MREIQTKSASDLSQVTLAYHERNEPYQVSARCFQLCQGIASYNMYCMVFSTVHPCSLLWVTGITDFSQLGYRIAGVCFCLLLFLMASASLICLLLFLIVIVGVHRIFAVGLPRHCAICVRILVWEPYVVFVRSPCVDLVTGIVF
jgi:hypothetical protein